MKTIIYKKTKELAGMATTYDYIVKYSDSSKELKSLDYLIPEVKGKLILEGKELMVIGSIFDLDDRTFKILVH